MDLKLIGRITRGDAEAADFLANHWARYCHAIDDLVDGELQGAEALLKVFAMAIGLYSHPFYLKHLPALRAVAYNVTEIYAQTVAWEGLPADTWQGQWADHHRHVSNEMVFQVALICGGYDHARLMMPELRVMAHAEHHDQQGKAV